MTSHFLFQKIVTTNLQPNEVNKIDWIGRGIANPRHWGEALVSNSNFFRSLDFGAESSRPATVDSDEDGRIRHPRGGGPRVANTG